MLKASINLMEFLAKNLGIWKWLHEYILQKGWGVVHDRIKFYYSLASAIGCTVLLICLYGFSV